MASSSSLLSFTYIFLCSLLIVLFCSLSSCTLVIPGTNDPTNNIDNNLLLDKDSDIITPPLVEFEAIQLQVPKVRMPRRLPGNGTMTRPDAPRPAQVGPPVILGAPRKCTNFPKSPGFLYPDDPPAASTIDVALRNFYSVSATAANSMATIDFCESELADLVINPHRPVGAASQLATSSLLVHVIIIYTTVMTLICYVL